MWYGIIRLVLCTARVGSRAVRKSNKAENSKPPQQPQVVIVERRGSGDYVIVNNQNGNAAADGVIHDG